MKVLAVVAHPDEQSLTRTLLDAALDQCQAAGAEVVVDDLYANAFDLVMRSSDRAAVFGIGPPDPQVLAEQSKIADADVLLLVHPVWWFYGPAILKGWFDRVFTTGFAFRMSETGPEGLLSDKKALVVQTAGQPPEWYAEQGAAPRQLQPRDPHRDLRLHRRR